MKKKGIFMQSLLSKFQGLKGFEDISLLILRFFMGATFIRYAVVKVEKFDWYTNWFTDTLALPFPVLNLYIATIVEGLGGLLLILGFFTRAISIPLIFTMLVALFLVNINNGFPASKFGMEIPLAYISILLILLTSGAGKFSIDNKLTQEK